MDAVLKNWKTTLTGVLIIGLAALHTFVGVNVPGAMDFGPALTMGIGLIFAHDGTA